jgi:hypothetical protein
VVACAPPHLSGSASVVAREPIEAHVICSSSQMPETRLSSVQVVLSWWTSYALWQGKVAKPFRARPPELATLRLGPMVPSRR